MSGASFSQCLTKRASDLMEHSEREVLRNNKAERRERKSAKQQEWKLAIKF